MNKIEAFAEWYDKTFMNTQGEDSPYSYGDVMAAFMAGWEQDKKSR